MKELDRLNDYSTATLVCFAMDQPEAKSHWQKIFSRSMKMFYTFRQFKQNKKSWTPSKIALILRIDMQDV